MTETEFNAHWRRRATTVSRDARTFADLDTPLSVYLKLADKPYSHLLESVQGGERFGRYSFIGISAQTRIAVYGHQVLVLTGQRISSARTTQSARVHREVPDALPCRTVVNLPRFCGSLG